MTEHFESMCYLIPGKEDPHNYICNNSVIIPPVLMPHIGFILIRFMEYVQRNTDYFWTIQKNTSTVYVNTWYLLAHEIHNGPILFRFGESIGNVIITEPHLWTSYKKQFKDIAPDLLLKVIKALEQIETMLLQKPSYRELISNQTPLWNSSQLIQLRRQQEQQQQQQQQQRHHQQQQRKQQLHHQQSPTQQGKCYCQQLSIHSPSSTKIPLPIQLLTQQQKEVFLIDFMKRTDNVNDSNIVVINF